MNKEILGETYAIIARYESKANFYSKLEEEQEKRVVFFEEQSKKYHTLKGYENLNREWQDSINHRDEYRRRRQIYEDFVRRLEKIMELIKEA